MHRKLSDIIHVSVCGNAEFQAQKEGLKEFDVIEAINKRCRDYDGQEVLEF
jgi:hypothetical protein